MNRKTIARMTAALAGVILAGGLLAGCMSPNTGATDQQQANRTYMTQVNRAMEDLNGRLAGFDEAVAQGNPVNMRAKADDAFAAIDDLE